MGPMSAFKSVVIGPHLPVIIVWLCVVSFKMLWVSRVGSAVAGRSTSLLFPQAPRNALECLRVLGFLSLFDICTRGFVFGLD